MLGVRVSVGRTAVADAEVEPEAAFVLLLEAA